MSYLKPITAALAAALVLFVAALAWADVAIYKNGFATRDAVNAIKQLGGGDCKRDHFEKKSLALEIDGGRGDCVFRTPVEGDSKQPDYMISASGIVAKGLDKKLRRDVYVGLAVRASAAGGYFLRVFPKGRRWQFLRHNQILDSGNEKAIKPLGKKNYMYLGVEKDIVRFGIKGQAFGSFEDPRAGDLEGKRTALVLGNVKKAQKNAVGVFDNLKVQVPAK